LQFRSAKKLKKKKKLTEIDFKFFIIFVGLMFIQNEYYIPKNQNSNTGNCYKHKTGI